MNYNKSYSSDISNNINQNKTINKKPISLGPYFNNKQTSSIDRILSDPRYDENQEFLNDPKYNTQQIRTNKQQSQNQQNQQNQIQSNQIQIQSTQIQNQPNQSKQSKQPKQPNQIQNQPQQINPKVTKVNSFKILEFGKVNTRSDYLADVGLISPPYVITDHFQILPFDEIDTNMKHNIINLLNAEFGVKDNQDEQDEQDEDNIVYSENFINTTWSGANIFYVMTSMDKSKLYGTIAIDRKNFYPYISQLYIVKEERYRNLSKHLINFANRYIKSLNFTQSRLWCENKLVSYYTKLGWHFEGKHNKLNIMFFNL